ncbi:hypothetical protein [Trichococcus pasteurii]|uniref:Uncharacterized protein n=1 Tax=Trichococcus pasteurii TaxID=43064 RepID=A0A1W1IBX6_9LACT|nr:hypothetical protein [Trichococcus pasteurii]SFE25811.1 hypothetical protein SAMN04488086_102179 [Trichococcus pasteurii]SLM50500.1 Hypothetical protein TPAS_172 [Trichococcus pasteurii]SSB91381.1 Hypothetical protein TPAS_172 [Trichococcus pasteurii]
MTYPIIIIVLLILTFIHITRKHNGKESRFPFTSVFLGVLFGYLHQATAVGNMIGIPDLALYLSLLFLGLATLQVLFGKSKQKREANARFRSGVSGLILGTGFLYLHTQTATDQLITARTGISDLTLYLAIGCYALAFLSFSANLNKLLKKQGTHFRNGVLGALFGTLFLFLDTQTMAGDFLANITGLNNLLLYAALVSYAIAVFSMLMEGNKRLKLASGNAKRAILCAGLGALLRYIHLRTTLDDLLGVSGWMGAISFSLFIVAAGFLALDLFKSGKFKGKIKGKKRFAAKSAKQTPAVFTAEQPAVENAETSGLSRTEYRRKQNL